MAKALGTEIIDFYTNGWPEGFCCDESELDVTEDGRIVPTEGEDPNNSLPVIDQYDLDRFGYIISETTREHFPFAHFFNRWRNEQTTATIIITVPKDKYDDALSMLKGLGYKIA